MLTFKVALDSSKFAASATLIQVPQAPIPVSDCSNVTVHDYQNYTQTVVLVLNAKPRTWQIVGTRPRCTDPLNS